MTKTKQVFAAIAPGLDGSLTESETETYIELAQDRISYSQFGGRYRQALAYLAAHIAQMAQERGGQGGSAAPGPIQSEKAGKVSRSYGVSGGSGSSQLESTAFGRQFMQIRNETATTSPLVTGTDLPDYRTFDE